MPLAPSPLLPKTRPLRVGDVLRLPSSGVTFRRVGPDQLDDLTVDFDTARPGLSRVLDISDKGVAVVRWGHVFLCMTDPAPLARHRLERLGRILAPERIGEFLVARHLRRLEGTGRALPQPLTRWLILRQRGELPALRRLGGRWKPWWRTELGSWLRHGLSARGWFPFRGGFILHGTLIDGIDREIRFAYGPNRRAIRLDQIYLHPNQNLHLIGRLVGSGERRRFVLEKCGDIRLADGTPIDPLDLHFDLAALQSSRADWYSTRRHMQARAGRPPPPAPKPWERRLTQGYSAWLRRMAQPRPRPPCDPAAGTMAASLCKRLARTGVAFPLPAEPPRFQPRSGQHLPAAYRRGADWRLRMVAAMLRIRFGQAQRSRVFHGMQALLSDRIEARAGLRDLMQQEARRPGGRHDRQALLQQVAGMMPGRGVAITSQERIIAWNVREGIRRRIDFPRHRDLQLAAACLEAAFRLNDRNHAAPLASDSGPEHNAFLAANAYFGSDWHDGRFKMNKACLPRMEALLHIWLRG